MRQHLSELTLAIDIGSTNHKLALIDEQLTTVFSAHRPIETSRQGERVEFSVEALEQNINLMLLEALQYLTAQKQPIKINACGITGQRSTVVFWDERGSLAPAISWQDLRTAESIRSLEPHRQEITDRSGLALTAHYSGSKLRWGLDHLPAVKQAYEKCTLKWGPVTTYLIWRLTQGKVYKIDHTQAQRTQLLNYRTRHWDQKLCNYFRIPSDLLPPLTTSFANYGSFCLGEWNVPIRAALGDTQAACLAQQLGKKHPLAIQYGSGAFLAYYIGNRAKQSPRLLTSIYYSTAKNSKSAAYFIEGTVNSAGTLLEWLQANPSLPTVETEITSNVVLPALQGMGAPYWRPEARPVLLGKKSSFNNENFSTAKLAQAGSLGIALRLRGITELLKINGYKLPKQIAVSGGLCERQDFLATQAAVLNLPLLRSTEAESTLIGAARLASSINVPIAKKFLQLQRPGKNRQTSVIPTHVQWQRSVRQALLLQKYAWFKQSLWQEKLVAGRPLFIGHRGTPDVAPENTLPSLMEAAHRGADGVEFDVRLSGDGVPVLFHDQTLERTTDGRGRVETYSLTQLKKLDAGSWYHQRYFKIAIPTLQEVFDSLPKNLLLYIELKDEKNSSQLWQTVVDLVDQNQCKGRTALCSFNTKMALKLKKQRPDLLVGGIFGSRESQFKKNLERFDELDILSVHHSHATAELVELSRLKQQLLMVWTVDGAPAQKKFVKLDLDAIVTNRLE